MELKAFDVSKLHYFTAPLLCATSRGQKPCKAGGVSYNTWTMSVCSLQPLGVGPVNLLPRRQEAPRGKRSGPPRWDTTAPACQHQLDEPATVCTCVCVHVCVRTHVRLCVWSMHGFHHQLVARLSDSVTVTHSGSCHPLSKTTEEVCPRDGCVWSPGNLGQMDIQELQTSTFNPKRVHENDPEEHFNPKGN